MRRRCYKAVRRLAVRTIQTAFLVGAVGLVGLLACTSGSAPTPTPTPTPTPGLLLPDLIAEPPATMYIRRNAETLERELWFSTTVSNIGDGSLEMIGAYDDKLNQTRAVQRIKTEEGKYEERVAGYFIFHEAHNHWHFEDFAELEVFFLGPEGSQAELVASTGKTTFCMQDTARLSSPPSNTPENAVYSRCDPVIQGISVGWADIYDPTIPGQQLNVEGLPDDTYLIRVTTDPAGRILEKTKDNNSSVVC